MRKLISLLGGGVFRGKEQLIKAVWNYSYESNTHDRLLHATIGKIRKTLGPMDNWLEWSNNGYRLTPQVQVLESETQAQRAHAMPMTVDFTTTAGHPSPSIHTTEFNHRQLTALRQMSAGQVLGVSDYAKKFRVCKMTACRDLSQLHQAGKIVRMGKARATKYASAPG